MMITAVTKFKPKNKSSLDQNKVSKSSTKNTRNGMEWKGGESFRFFYIIEKVTN